MATPGTYNTTFYQGQTETRTVTVEDGNGTPIDLTGCTIAGQMRLKPEDRENILAFTCTITDAVNGEYTFSLTATQTSSIPVQPSGGAHRKMTQYAYDIEITYPSGRKERNLEGVIDVSPEVTK